MNSNAYPSSSYPPSQQNINPAMLSRAAGGYSNNNPMGMMPGNNMNINMMPGASINPAQLMNGMGGQSMPLNPAPAQLLHQQQQQQQQHQQMMMNGGMGMGGGSMGGMGMGGGMSTMGGMGMGGGNMGMNMGGGGVINPASLSAPSPSSINPGMMQHQPQPQAQHPSQIPNMGGMNMAMQNHMGPGGMALSNMGYTREQLAAMPLQERQARISAAMQAANAMGYTREQLAAMPPQERQAMISATMQAASTMGYGGSGASERQQHHSQHHPQHSQQQQHGGGQVSPQNSTFFDRPSSSASSHSHSHSQQGMMPPPQPRPLTAQGMNQQGHPSRPGTAMSHRSPTIPGPQLTSMGGQGGPQGMQRPPSRVASAGGGEFSQQNMFNAQNNANMNGYPPSKPASISTPQPQQPHTPQPYQQQQQGGHGSPPPMPGSPYRGTNPNHPSQKKKLSESPRIGGSMGLPPQQSHSSSSSSRAEWGHDGPSWVATDPSAETESQADIIYGHGSAWDEYAWGGDAETRAASTTGVYASAANADADAVTAAWTPMRQGSAPPPQAQIQQKVQEMRMSAPPPPSVSAPPAGVPSVPIPPVPAPPVIAPSASTSSASGPVVPPPAAQNGPVVHQLPPLPAGVNLAPGRTCVSVVPLIDSLKHIPTLSESEIKDIQGWMKVDNEYDALHKKMKDSMTEEARDAFGLQNAAWWQKGYPGGNWSKYRRAGREGFDVRYPRRRGEPSGSRKKPGKREGLRLPRKIDLDAANLPEQLVPIRLEFDVEHHKMRDTFIWNLNGSTILLLLDLHPVVTPEVFAQSIVDDYALAQSYHGMIVKHIQDQLSDYKAHSVNYDGEGGEFFIGSGEKDVVFKGNLDEEESKWWEKWRKRVRSETEGVGARRKRRKMVKMESEDRRVKVEFEDGAGGETTDGEDEKDKPLALEEFSIEEEKLHEEMRILIKLDIIVGSMKLDDQFEWDLDNPDASPEQFAVVYTQELGLGGEFQTAIAHSIREQVQTYQKSLFLVGHPSDGSIVQDDELRQSFLPSLASGARSVNEVQLFTPLLNYLSDGEIERNEKERDKDLNKRRKRNTRGRRGVALPDREPIRTYRTPAIGFPELDPATLALAAAANAPVSRRAAAAAASLTIANMVASENGERFTPQMMPAVIPQPQPSATKEKKPKGLFKPPSFPSSVLRPRAHVTAPTPSTAADVSKLPAPLENDPPPPIPTVPAPPDSKAQKAITAKRAKELEREAKEKEFVDGQHPNYIDGVWHCSNCGCPESIAIGRRKGPLGDKSQCGTCGKFWHRHRRPRPIEYNSDPDFHSNLRRAEEAAKAPGAKKKGAAAALRAQSAATATPVPDISEPQTPARSNGDAEAPSRQSPAPEKDDDRAMSPMSTASSASEAPLAQKVKMNGANHKAVSTPAKSSSSKPLSTPAKAGSTPKPITPAPISSASAPPQSEGAGQSTSAGENATTPVLSASSAKSTWSRYPNDRFEVILRKVGSSSTPEWRIKCSDCPGKLYTPGPGETLSNYEVHLKNRIHRQRVNERVSASNS
ncbi:hypothetical protein BDQ17DRAFT_1321887 [Cyathus striatus]|nr:hypothetical protein BDQ17DRAFT_1321887 [Cyathus striatus]